MSGVFFPNDPEGPFHAIHMPDFGISWAGANPFGEGFCFGSEDGNLVLTDTKGNPRSFLGKASASGEAINGVAFSHNWLAVTTRKDINFIPIHLLNREDQGVIFIAGGGQDVVAAPSGQFVIPLGKTGIMLAKPGMTDKDPVTISNANGHGMNFSRIVVLKGGDQTELIVAAGRRGGVGFTSYKEGIQRQVLTTVKFNELDIVDVCSIRLGTNDRAVAAAGRDGSLVLFKDILADKNPVTFKFQRITGSVYRLIGAGGDLYLLTSNGLFAIFGLAERFLAGQPLRQVTTDVLRLPIEGADANLVDERWLLVAGVDDLFRLDVTKIPKQPPVGEGSTWDQSTAPEALELAPEWAESGFDQMAMAL
jgi:hypothetical protein